MKKIVFLMIVFCVVGMVFSSCSKAEAEREGNEIRLRNENNDGEYLELLKVDSALHRYGYRQGLHEIDDYYDGIARYYQDSVWVDKYYSLKSELGIDDYDNFKFYGQGYGKVGDISSVGPVNDLGDIKKIPEGGWSRVTAVQPGYGYVVRVKQDYVLLPPSDDDLLTYYFKKICRYARIYVVDWDVSTTGEILGATIRYQDNWKIED